MKTEPLNEQVDYSCFTEQSYRTLCDAICRTSLVTGDGLSILTHASPFRVIGRWASEAVSRIVRDGSAGNVPHGGIVMIALGTREEVWDISEVCRGPRVITVRAAGMRGIAGEVCINPDCLVPHEGTGECADQSMTICADLEFRKPSRAAALREQLALCLDRLHVILKLAMMMTSGISGLSVCRMATNRCVRLRLHAIAMHLIWPRPHGQRLCQGVAVGVRELQGAGRVR